MQLLVICYAYPGINPIILANFFPVGYSKNYAEIYSTVLFFFCHRTFFYHRNVQFFCHRTKPDTKHIFTWLTEQKSFILSSCIIIANIKYTFWQVSILENRFSGKCPFGQMYILASVRSGKCTFGIMSNSAKYFSWKCPFWKMFFGEMYRIRRGAKFFSATSLFRLLISFGKLSNSLVP